MPCQLASGVHVYIVDPSWMTAPIINNGPSFSPLCILVLLLISCRFFLLLPVYMCVFHTIKVVVNLMKI